MPTTVAPHFQVQNIIGSSVILGEESHHFDRSKDQGGSLCYLAIKYLLGNCPIDLIVAKRKIMTQ